MTLMVPGFDDAVVVRAADAEVIGGGPVTGRLIADSSATGGALSAQRITLGDGANGATPHHHRRSAEMFYVLDGAAEFLAGEEIVTGSKGDLIVVPPNMPHAFAAVPGADADLLIVITPGVERFAYFRHLQRVALGELTPESLLEVQERYDNHFLSSATWEKRR
ncbi:cupin domain-containing protein [Streptomyces sp. VRA16 Mangrove soil]|uniref:cupin domain-containing protein n=1 Tax=Streptomyces sp. VRA16 Mangrove soil TaxID=2817434 RepID=UPI001A9F9FDF|nr:cupin domain-containing protein [Streptomyces sp. VRA16 Mangrove soil]MBO1336360.1 cupin domain-containing protein [Streptomyces sp. VRA16 Mangrove soil]